MPYAVWFASNGRLLLLVGGIVIVSLLARRALERRGLPDLLAFLALGIALRALNTWTGVLSPAVGQGLNLLADVGIIVLLFRVGMRCNAVALWQRLPRALPIAATTMLFGGMLVVGIAALGFGRSLLSSLFLCIALAGTSVGVASRLWQRHGVLNAPEGFLLLDVAELNDLLSVVGFAGLLALAAHLNEPRLVDWMSPAAHAVGGLLLKLAGLTVISFVLERYVAPLVTDLLDTGADTLLVLLGMALLVSGLTALADVPIALGGFFAGLLFSRQSVASDIDPAFDTLYDLFVPFFYVGIGVLVDGRAVLAILPFAATLLAALMVGQGLAAYLPARQLMDATTARRFSISLLPRSGIPLIIAEKGWQQNVLSRADFTVVVVIVLATLVGVPLLLQLYLPEGPEGPAEDPEPSGPPAGR
ncbi:cation:proton antiporter [Salisaeta longa]|uniref:cation:proton antiporter n=1 Tax=Salisaeta longa TaxID=503170 RepID=UPI0003B2EF52|nr:cation:proton antiporter [Salisaeta longa]